MKIVITGATGFVGTNLKYFLAKFPIGISQPGRDELKKLTPDLLEGTTSIVHLAGKAHDIKNASNPEEYYETNFELTKRLYDAFLKSNAEKFIFISSVKAAADKVDRILAEDILPNPETHYGLSKLKAEEYILSKELPADKAYYIIRPCMIHGPGNKGNLNLLYQIVKKGIPYPLAGFMNRRSFLSVENLCFVISELILRKDIPSGIYHIADDEPLSTNEVVSLLSLAVNKKVRLWKISPSIIRLFAKLGDKLHLPLTTERLDKLTESYVVSNEKIKKAIQKPMPLSAKEGLKITALSFKKI